MGPHPSSLVVVSQHNHTKKNLQVEWKNLLNQFWSQKNKKWWCLFEALRIPRKQPNRLKQKSRSIQEVYKCLLKWPQIWYANGKAPKNILMIRQASIFCQFAHFTGCIPNFLSTVWTSWWHKKNQINYIFHQPRFPWNKGISLTKPQFGVKSVVWGTHYNLTRYILHI